MTNSLGASIRIGFLFSIIMLLGRAAGRWLFDEPFEFGLEVTVFVLTFVGTTLIKWRTSWLG